MSLVLATLGAPARGSVTEASPPSPSVSHAEHRVLVKLEAGARATEVLGNASRGILGRWRSLPVPPGRSPEEAVANFKARPGVETAELDYQVEIDPTVALGALSHSGSVAVDDPNESFQWHFPAIQLAEAWAASTGSGVVVAVVDTGVSKGGEDLGCHTFVSPYDAIDKVPGETAASDDNGHGTHVAGTVAQCTDNGVGVAGVAFDASLLPVKALDSNGIGSVSDVAHGIDWARTHGADVINLSLGGQFTSDILDDAIEAAVAEGITVVAAAGNDDASAVFYPASHPDVIAVGATEFNNQRAPYSNVGSALDLVAPGGDIDVDANGDGHPDGVLQETVCFASASDCPPSLGGGNGWDYYFLEGTSMATPHVAGAAALLKSIAPRLDGVAVRSVLEATALDLGPSGFDPSYGHGLIQLHDAVELLGEPDSSSPTWPGGAELSVEFVAGGTAEISWPEASDNKAVAGYRATRDGSVVSTINGAGQTSTLVTGLASATEYELGVQAEDLDGNLSTPLVAEIATLDFDPPTWGSSAHLSVKSYGERELTLRWSGASDDVGVVGYRLRVAGTTGILSSAREATVTGLEPGTDYRFEVLARDAAGNVSEVLSRTVPTARAFRDTRETTFYDDILWMSGETITRGCNPPVNDLYCPDDPLTRGQMAAFVVRALDLGANDHPGFRDVAPDSTFAADIGRLATAGVTRGCNPPDNDRFCPDDQVTRGQMAAFTVRALGLTVNTHPGFVDVPASSTFAADIGRLATAGITRGCNPPDNDRFCPNDPVTRGQLAAFLRRALD